jgi:hypothetical protein
LREINHRCYLCPADISYPTDLGLLNGARVHTEKIIDILYKQIQEKNHKKPRTYRNLARKDYLAVANKEDPPATKEDRQLKNNFNISKETILILNS